MESPHVQAVMPKQVSGLNTYWLVQYLENHHPSLDLAAAIDTIANQFPCWIENLTSGVVEQVTLSHLRQERYWFSHRFIKALHEQIQQVIPDPRLGFKIGSTMFRSQPLIRTAIGIPLLGVQRVAQRVSQEAAKFNRTKKYEIRKQGPGLVVIRITHNPDIDICGFTMQWNAGCFYSYAKLAGATEVNVDLHCIDPGTANGGAIWDFTIRYQDQPLLTRLAKGALSSIPWIRELTIRAEEVEADHTQQILNRDEIIRERTEHLLSLQQKLIEEERTNIEQQLQQMSLELVATEERERKAIAEDLHDSVTQLLALSLSKVKKAKQKNLLNPELIEIQDHLELALNDLRSLTFQISPPVLYDFGLEAALEWLVDDVNSRHNMQLLFTNLLPAPLQPNHQQKVTLYRAVRELIINIIKHSGTENGQVILRQETSRLILEVADEGCGFHTSSIEPGFGLYSLKERLGLLNGQIEILSTPGEGSIFMLSMPLDSIPPVARDGKPAASPVPALPSFPPTTSQQDPTI